MSKNFCKTGEEICGIKEKRGQSPASISRKIKGFCSHIGTLLTPATPLLSEIREEEKKSSDWFINRMSDMAKNYILELCARHGIHKPNGRLAHILKCQLNEALSNTPNLRTAFNKVNEPDFSIASISVQNGGMPTRKYIIKGKGTLILILRDCRVLENQKNYHDGVSLCVQENYTLSKRTYIMDEEALQSLLSQIPQILKIHFKEICIISCNHKTLKTHRELMEEHGVLSCEYSRYCVQRNSFNANSKHT